MAKQHGVGPAGRDLCNDLPGGERSEFAVEKLDLMASVHERAAHAEKAERRQMLPGDAAAYGCVRWIYKDDFMALSCGGFLPEVNLLTHYAPCASVIPAVCEAWILAFGCSLRQARARSEHAPVLYFSS